MSRPVNDLVSKPWARMAKKILRSYSPDITTLFTRLLTMASATKEETKTLAGRALIDQAYGHLRDAIQYGWAFGIAEQQLRFKRPNITKPYRRIRALLPLAVEAGRAIGEAQAKKIRGTGKSTTAPAKGPATTGHEVAGGALLST
jgi:hypothetical protein